MLTVVTPNDLCEDGIAFMTMHGCHIVTCDDYCEVTFPEGTKCERIFPQTMDERFRLMLPDGCIMKQLNPRCLEQSLLYYPPQCVHDPSNTILKGDRSCHVRDEQ